MPHTPHLTIAQKVALSTLLCRISYNENLMLMNQTKSGVAMLLTFG